MKSSSFVVRARVLSVLLPVSLTVLLLGVNAQANIGEDYAFGARTGALAGAGAAWGFGAFAAYDNPAGLPFEGQKRLLLQVGLIDMNPNFTSISGVVIENKYVSDKIAPVYGNVSNDYRATLGEELGIVYRLFPEWANLTFGLTAFLPLQQAAYMDTGETFEPEYVLYRARTQRPQVELGAGADITPNIHVGVGLHLAFSLTSSGTVFIKTDATQPSTMRFSSSLKPKLSPQVGILYTSELETPNSEPRWTLGAVFRAPVASDNTLYLQSGAQVFGGNAALDFNFSALSSLFYDPLALELGSTFAETSSTRTYAQLEFQAWSAFQAPALSIQNPGVTSCDPGSGGGACGLKISGSNNPAFAYRNIFVPRVGQEYRLDRLTLRAGYAYRQGIISSDGAGAGNYLDPSSHIFTVGAGYHFQHFLNFDVPCDLDLNLAYHALVGQHVTKTAGDEAGDSSSGEAKIGAPGYDAGGSVYGGGLSLSMAF